ncbi:MAG: hypothetical protein ACTHQ3_15920 [Motilibacteraceae bacterium]
MAWFKVDDNLTFHHKVVAAGNPAMGLWVRAGAWCALQLTDGLIPDHMLAALGTKGQAERLVSVGLWERVDGAYRFHAWCERQPSKADVEAERAAARLRMQKARAARKGVTPQVKDGGSPELHPNVGGTSGEVTVTRPSPSPDPVPVPNGTEKNGRQRPSPPPEAVHLCTVLADLIEANGSKRPEITQKWLNDARLMIQRDGRKPEQAERLIRWTQGNTFWRSNVLSMPTFRQKYDQLRLQALEDWERGRAAVSPDGAIDVDAILGAEKFVPPAPPDDLNPGTPAWQRWHRDQRDQWKADRERRAREIVARRSA